MMNNFKIRLMKIRYVPDMNIEHVKKLSMKYNKNKIIKIC